MSNVLMDTLPQERTHHCGIALSLPCSGSAPLVLYFIYLAAELLHAPPPDHCASIDTLRLLNHLFV